MCDLYNVGDVFTEHCGCKVKITDIKYGEGRPSIQTEKVFTCSKCVGDPMSNRPGAVSGITGFKN